MKYLQHHHCTLKKTGFTIVVKFRKSVKCCMLPQTCGHSVFEMNLTDIIYSLTEAIHCGSN